MKTTNRRTFAKTISIAALAGASALTFSPIGCSKKETTAPNDDSNVFKLSLVEAPELAAIGGVVSMVANGIPITVFRLSADGFVTFSRICPYESCTLEWDVDADKFVCPCNDGTFDRNGNVVSGPSTRRLTTFDTAFDARENVVVIEL